MTRHEPPGAEPARIRVHLPPLHPRREGCRAALPPVWTIVRSVGMRRERMAREFRAYFGRIMSPQFRREMLAGAPVHPRPVKCLDAPVSGESLPRIAPQPPQTSRPAFPVIRAAAILTALASNDCASKNSASRNPPLVLPRTQQSVTKMDTPAYAALSTAGSDTMTPAVALSGVCFTNPWFVAPPAAGSTSPAPADQPQRSSSSLSASAELRMAALLDESCKRPALPC